jgi:addiction module HigA family antidote
MANKQMRKPSSPGEILSLEFLGPMGITQRALAEHIGVEVKAVNRLINGHTSATPRMAVLLGGALGTTPAFWLNLQSKLDLYAAASEGIEVPSRLAAIG